MHGYLKDEKTSHLLFIGVWIAYTVLCLTRNTYSTAIASIVDEGLFTKSDAGIINAVFYLIYGTALLVGGKLTDKLPPWYMITVGIIGALAANIVMAQTRSFHVMLIAWSVNGLLQFAVWPSVVNIIATVLKKEHRQKAALYISVCVSTGYVLGYFAAMLLLAHYSWASLFRLAVILLILVLVLWQFVTMKTKKKLCFDKEDAIPAQTEAVQAEKEKVHFMRILLLSGFFLLLVPSVGRAMLDLGVKSWVPTMMMENYGIMPDTASFIAMIVALVNISGVLLAAKVQKRLGNCPVSAVAVFLTVSLPFFGMMLFIGKIPIAFVTVLLLVTTTLSYSMNQLIVVQIPTSFQKYNCIGLATSIMNAFASFGATLGNYGFGFIADKMGWHAVIVSWLVIAAVGALCTFLALPAWKKFFSN